jgi:hypothetical protein
MPAETPHSYRHSVPRRLAVVLVSPSWYGPAYVPGHGRGAGPSSLHEASAGHPRGSVLRGAAEGAMTQPHGLGHGAVDRRSIIDGHEGRFGRRRIHQ